MYKPTDSKQPFSTNLPREIDFNRTCRHCGVVFQCDYADYAQWLNGELARPWRRERTCSAACHAVVGDMPAMNVKAVGVTKLPFHNPDFLERHVIRHAPDIAKGRTMPKARIE